MIPTHHPLIKAGYFPGTPSRCPIWFDHRPPGGRSKVDLTLDLSSNDLRVAGAKAMASLLEMDTVRREGTWDSLGRWRSISKDTYRYIIWWYLHINHQGIQNQRVVYTVDWVILIVEITGMLPTSFLQSCCGMFASVLPPSLLRNLVPTTHQRARIDICCSWFFPWFQASLCLVWPWMNIGKTKLLFLCG